MKSEVTFDDGGEPQRITVQGDDIPSAIFEFNSGVALLSMIEPRNDHDMVYGAHVREAMEHVEKLRIVDTVELKEEFE